MKGTKSHNTGKFSSSARSLQLSFIPVFYLLRCADWLQGLFFYEVYASKAFDRSNSLVSKVFTAGFASAILFGPMAGGLTDCHGRKRGTLAFAVVHSLGAISTKCSKLHPVILGRIMSGIGSCLLYSAPESWLVAEAKKRGCEKHLEETFSLAYAGDSIIAILASQLGKMAAMKRGPTGPFELSVGFLAFGAVLICFLWKENVEEPEYPHEYTNKKKVMKPICGAVRVIQSDPKLFLVGSVQSLFETAMFIFVMKWPLAASDAVIKCFGNSASTPYVRIFCSLMACCLLGSLVFGKISRNQSQLRIESEEASSLMLLLATLAVGVSAVITYPGLPRMAKESCSSIVTLALSFFLFEACVGFYFPSIATLRSKYIPDCNRCATTALIRIPLDFLVVGVFFSMKRLAVSSAFAVSSFALGMAYLSMKKLSLKEQEEKMLEKAY